MIIDKEIKFFLLFLFAFSFLVRAVVFVGFLSKNENYWQVDSNTYHLVAQQIAQGHGISSSDGTPHFHRLPGYPLFLSLYYRLFGPDTKLVLWGQIFLGALIPLLVFLLSLTLFPGAILVAKLASLWAAIHLGLVLYSGFFMTETLFIFLLLLFFIFFFHREQKTYNYIFFAGLFLGLASLVRPVGHYLLVLTIGLLLCRKVFSGEVKEGTHACGSASIKNTPKAFPLGQPPRMLRFLAGILKPLTFACAWALPVSFWLLRNFLLTGHLFFHTLPGGHFLYLSAARVAMHTQNCSYQQARENLSREVHDELAQKQQALGRPLSQIESCNVHEQLAIKYFKQSPFIAIKNWCTDMFRTMFSLYSSELLFLDSGRQEIDYFKKDRSWWHMLDRYLFPKTDSKFLKIIIWSEILIYLLMLFGFFMFILNAFFAAINHNFELLRVLGMCAPFMGLFIVIALSGGYARMRLPIEPFLLIFSCVGWVWLLKREHHDQAA